MAGEDVPRSPDGQLGSEQGVLKGSGDTRIPPGGGLGGQPPEETEGAARPLEAVIDNIPLMLVATDEEFRALVWNRECERVTGYSAQEAMSHEKPVALLFPDAADQEAMLSRFRDPAQHGKDWIETITCKDGRQRTVSWRPMSQCCPVEGWPHWGVGLDITARLEAEKALRQSEKRFRLLVENADDIVVMHDLAGRIIYYNAPEKYSRTASEVLGKTPHELFGQEVGELVMAQMREVAESGKSAIVENSCGWEGEDLWFSDVVYPIRDASGKVTAVGKICRDVTEMKHTQAALLKASRMEATATMAGGIAHDFNNLMVGVVGNAEMLRDDLQDLPEAQEILDDIINSGRRAGELAQKMLAYARGGRHTVQTINLNDIVLEILRLQERTTPPRIQFHRLLDPELWTIRADGAQMNQVIMNLCINAVEAICGPGSITVVTENADVEESGPSALVPPGPYVRLTVEDTGCGMDADVTARVFEPFFSGKFQGRGLGLAAVYGIVKNHGGHISVDTREGEGTAFVVYLPATPGAEMPESAVEPGYAGGTETILLIDDENVVVQTVTKFLGRLGYQVVVARDGQEALEKAESFDGDIHLALLDIAMPKKEGPEVYPQLMALRPGLKVLICSGYELAGASQALLDAGADGFIQKPFAINVLAEEIRRVLDGASTP